LRIRPDSQDGGGHHVGGGMADPLEVGHLGAFVERFTFGHGSRTENPMAVRYSRGKSKGNSLYPPFFIVTDVASGNAFDCNLQPIYRTSTRLKTSLPLLGQTQSFGFFLPAAVA
jgi:hypothetical protein